MKKRLAPSIFIALILLVIVSIPVLAAYSLYITVSETEGNSYTQLPIIYSKNVSLLESGGFITATGLDTRVTLGATELPHMLSNDKILFVSDVDDNSETEFTFSAGNSALTSFPIVLGEGGYITRADDAALELEYDFEIQLSGYFNTSGVNDQILYKQDSIVIYNQAAGTIRAAILSAGDVEDYAVDAVVASGEHIINVGIDESYLFYIEVDGTVEDSISTFISYDDSAAASTVQYRTGTINDMYEPQGDRMFNAAGRYWVFSDDYSNTYLNTSTDGSSWSAASTIAASQHFACHYNKTDNLIHITYSDSSENYYYRVGAPETDGSITWLDSLQSLGNYNGQGRVNIITDTSGYPVIALSSNETGSYRVHVLKSSTKDGTWTDATDFPYVITDWSASGITPTIVSMPSNAFYVMESAGGTERGILWNGSWGSVEAPSMTIGDTNIWKTVSDDSGNIYSIYGDDYSNTLYYAHRDYATGLWNITNSSIGGGAYPRGIGLTLMSNGDLFAFRLDNDRYIRYKNFDTSTSTWDASWTDWKDETAYPNTVTDAYCYSLTSVSYGNSGKASAAWYLRNTASTPDDHYARFCFIDVQSASVPDTANDYLWMQDDSMPYADYLKIAIDNTYQLRYEPNDIIAGTTLPDRAGTAQNGVITWGTNPVGLEFEESTKEAKSAVSDPGAGAGQSLITSVPDPITGMYDEGSTSGIPIAPLIDPALIAVGIPLAVFWYPIAFAVAIILGFAAYAKTRTLLVQAAVSAVVMACFCGGGLLGTGLLPYWTVLVFVLEAILLIIIQEKQHV